MHRALSICAALAVCLPSFAHPQQPAPALSTARPPAQPAAVGIQLDVTVTDKSGNPVSGLSQSDFTLLDNGQPAKIVSFHAYDPATPPVPPVEVIILFDTVNQGFTTVSYDRLQVAKFLRQNGGRLAQPVKIEWLTNTDVKTMGAGGESVAGGEDQSLDGNALAAQLDASDSWLRTITRTTRGFAAVDVFEYSLKMLDMIAAQEGKTPGRKLLIWAGPGWPMLDTPGITFTSKNQQLLFDQIVALNSILRQGHISLYSVSEGVSGPYTFLYQAFLKGVKKWTQAAPSDLALKVLAVQSGGLALPPSNDLVSSINDCARDSGPFYSVTIEPAPPDQPNEYHELKVRVDKPGLTARTNSGYYNQPARQTGGPAAP
jgi:VWFA-related protein